MAVLSLFSFSGVATLTLPFSFFSTTSRKTAEEISNSGTPIALNTLERMLWIGVRIGRKPLNTNSSLRSFAMKRMSAFVMILSSLLLPLCAFADAPPSLKDNMGAIGKLVKSITLSVNDKTKNAASAAQAKQLELLFTAVLAQEPDTIAQLPQNQQAPALAQFKTLIQQEITDSQRLETAFASSDNATAGTILQSMQDDKKTGHDKFKKD